MTQTIYPTHTCFDDALDLLTELIKANPKIVRTNEILLVHGICFAPELGEYSHAWLEMDGEYVLWVGILKGQRQEFKSSIKSYYEHFNVIETTKYTPRQAWEKNNEFVTYGPWEEKYLKLVRSK